MTSKESRDTPRRSLDAAGRQRRARKALEALEQDNYHEDPHQGLVMSKKAPKFGGEGRRKRGRGGEARQRHRKNLSLLLEEEAVAAPMPAPGEKAAPSYLTATAPPPLRRVWLPRPVHLCGVRRAALRRPLPRHTPGHALPQVHRLRRAECVLYDFESPSEEFFPNNCHADISNFIDYLFSSIFMFFFYPYFSHNHSAIRLFSHFVHSGHSAQGQGLTLHNIQLVQFLRAHALDFA